MAESGIAEVPTDISYSVFAPASTPATVIDRLNSAINEGMSSPELRATAGKLGIDIKLGTTADAAATVANDCPRWIASAKLAGIKVE